MGEFQQYFDIILFAMVAAFLVLRLRSVLGRKRAAPGAVREAGEAWSGEGSGPR